jgi:multiple sugar transport system permease protein
LLTLWVPLGAFLVFTLGPFYYMLVISLKDQQQEVNDPRVFPFWVFHPNLNQYIDLFARTQFPRWALNTIIVASLSTVVSLTFGTLAGYALARLRFRGAENLGIAIFMTYLVPPILLFIPLVQIVNNVFNLLNTKWALVLIYPTFTIPFCLWLMLGFFKRIPIEIEEAALVDGCNRWQAVLHVVLPVSVPGILTVAIFAFTLSMQDFIYALVMVSPSAEKVLTIGIPTELIRGDVFYWGELFTAALIPAIIVAAFYNFFLDYFIEGITGGAVK